MEARGNEAPGVGTPVHCIDPAKLQVGDVVLTTDRTSWKSWLIRVGTGSGFSHAAIHVGAGFLVEAVPGGVRQVHCRRFAFAPGAVRVLRAKATTHGELETVAAQAKQLVYRPYATGKLACPLLGFGWPDKTGRFCSELVAESYLGCIDLRKDSPEYVTPGHLGRSDQFENVTEGTLLAVASADLAAGIQSYQETIEWSLNRYARVEKPTPEQVESSLVEAAWRVMNTFDFFNKPYHLVDVYRQLSARRATYGDAVRSADDEVARLMEEFGVDESGVLPRKTMPNLTSIDIISDMILPVASSDSNSAIEAMSRLAGDLVAGKMWYLEELGRSEQEYKKKADATGLRTHYLAAGWVRSDIWYAEVNYEILERFANPHIIETDG